MTVKEMIEFAVQKANLGNPGEINSLVYNFALSAINDCADKIWKMKSWENSKLFSLSVTTDEPVIRLPSYVELVRAVRLDNRALFAKDEIVENMISPDNFDGDGETTGYIHYGTAPVLKDLTALSSIVLHSSSGEDLDRIVKIEGMDGDNAISEEICLDGSREVESRWQYDRILGISKGLTRGRITVCDEDRVYLASMEPSMDRTAYRQIKLIPFKTDTLVTVHIFAKRKFMRMLSDHDVFPLSQCEDGLKNMLIADLLEYDQKLDQAAYYKKNAFEAIELAESEETKQRNQECRLIPQDPMFGEEY
jgi:hypothetical protein